MTVIKHKDQRVGVFIDIQNLYHSAKNLYNARVNFKELLKEAVSGRKLIRAIAYVVKSEGLIPDAQGRPAIAWSDRNDGPGRTTESEPAGKVLSGEASFFEALEREGIELRVKDIQVYSGGFKKADWDVGMAVDAIRMAEFLDAVVLVTGDGDFMPLVEYLQSRGRQVEVMAFGRSASGKLKEAADVFIDMGEGQKYLLKIAKSSYSNNSNNRKPRLKGYGHGRTIAKRD